MEQVYAALLQWVQTYGLPGVFLFMVAENVGIPFPTELGFITAQGLVASHTVPYLVAFAWIAAGHLVGAGISYYMGRGTNSALTRRLSRRRTVVAVHEKLQGWYARYGAMTLVFGRLEGHVRPWASFVAGLSGVGAATFWLWTIIGTAAFVAITMWVTAVGWQFWLSHAQWRVPLAVAVLLIFYGLPAYKLGEYLIKRRGRQPEQEPQEGE